MKKKLSIAWVNMFLLACMLLFQKTNLRATHITGGELSYECLGNFTYKLTLKIYRDCLNGEAGFDDPAKITVWSGIGAYLQVLEVPYTGATTLPYVAADTNWVPVGYACVEEAVYIDTVIFGDHPTGYTFAYQRCCRTYNITNLVNPGTIGSTYWEKVPFVGLCNSSPSFNQTPPLVLCANRPMTFDHSATDLDGDSLVYHLCGSFDGASQSDPEPYITSPPPFSNITYLAPYTEINPIPGLPGMVIDPLTGIVTITPSVIGHFVVGICCDEYRNGTLLGSHHRDFRYTVEQCPYGIGIENYTFFNAQVFPNPTIDQVEFISEEEVNIMVVDLMGKIVYQSSCPAKIHRIQTLTWTQGVYNVKGYSNRGFYCGKLIKE